MKKWKAAAVLILLFCMILLRSAGQNRQSDGFLPEYPQISFL